MFNRNPAKFSSQSVVTQDVNTTATILRLIKKLGKYLRERDFKWPNPIPSTDHPNHYMTFIEISRLDKEFFSYW